MPSGHFSRVEPPPSPGIPDINYCVDGIEGWIELKTVDPGTFPFARKGLRASQRRWIKRRLVARGRVFVFVAFRDYFLVFHGSIALQLKKTHTVEDFKSVAIAKLPRRASPELTQELRYILVEK